MLNKIEDYAEAGMKAAEARHQKDEARALYWSRWAYRAIALEKSDERAACSKAYNLAYKETAHSSW